MQEFNTLRSLFRADLDAEARKNGWGLKERVLWIMDHLDEYIERWLGFAALLTDPKALIQSDLFTVVEIAVEALEEEFAHAAGSLDDRRVKRIRGAVEALRRHGDEEYAIAIKELAGELRFSSPLLKSSA
jgi:hypothetical protein